MRAQATGSDASYWLLRVGLAIVFLYAGIDAFREPAAWVSYVPQFSTHFVAVRTSLDGISVVQIAVALALLAGKFVRYAAAVAALLLAGIIVFNLGTLLITFRDIGLLCTALALVVSPNSGRR